LEKVYNFINEKYITKSMPRTNTVHIILGKENRAKLTAIGKAFVNCWNEVKAIAVQPT
jgi:stage V sporulation protein SpoVS